MTTIRPGMTVRTPRGLRARVAKISRDGDRATLEYLPDEPPEFGKRPDEVVLPVKLLKVDGVRR